MKTQNKTVLLMGLALIALGGIFYAWQSGYLVSGIIGSTQTPTNPATSNVYYGDDNPTYNHTKFCQSVTPTTSETVDTLYAFLRQSRSGSLASAMPIIYSTSGTLLMKGPIKTPPFTSADAAGFHWEKFPLDSSITITSTVRIGLVFTGSAILLAYNSPVTWTAWMNREANINDARCPSNPFDASGLKGDYVTSGHTDMADTFCLYLAGTTPYPPTARFTVSTTVAQVNTPISFDASASTAGWNGTAFLPILDYSWSFGDGQTANYATPTTSHSYTAPGEYTVSLTVSSSATDVSTPSTLVVTIQAGVPLSVEIAPLTADVYANQQLTLTATVSGGQGTTTTLEWYEGITTQTLKQTGGQTTYIFFGSTYSAGDSVKVYCKASKGAETATSSTATMTIVAPPMQGWGISISSTSGGTTDKIGSINMAVGTSLIVTAQPSADYLFDHWQSDISSINQTTDNPVTVPAQAEGSTHTLLAVFNPASTPPQEFPSNWLILGALATGIILAALIFTRKKKR